MNTNVKKISKIVAVILIIMMAFTIVQPVFAAAQELKPGDLTASYKDTGALKDKAGQIMGLIRNIAVIVGVIMLMVIGVKFMLGSAEEKADYKKSLLPLTIGIIIVMLATQIVTMVYNFVQ